MPAGTSSTIRSTAARYWRTSVTRRSASTGTIVTAPGWWTMKRSKGPPSGSSDLGLAHGEDPTSEHLHLGHPAEWHRCLTRVLGHAIEVEQVRLAPLGPVERRRHQFTEQGVGPVGSALELGVGLGADPERVLAQLDELDQAPVG